MKNNKVLITTTTPYMIKSFLMNDIKILIELGYKVEVGTNFQTFNVMSDESLQELKKKLIELGVKMNQIEFSRSVFNLKKMLQSFNETKTLIDKNKYVIIHTHTPISGIITRLANKHTRTYSKTRMIYTAHGFHFFKGNNPIKNIIFKTIEKYAAKYTDILITINKEDYEAAKKFKLKKNGVVKYVPGVGIDLKKINSVQGNKNELCKKLGIPNESLILLSVGELSKRKNHKVVIKSIVNLPNNVHYLICGQGALNNYLIQLSTDLNIASRVHLLGYQTNIPEIMKSSDIFIFPSLQEGLPVALMEALACGIPCIASRIRGNEDLIENNNYYRGYLVNGFITSEWSNQIKKCINNHEPKKNERDMKTFGNEYIINQMKNLYKM